MTGGTTVGIEEVHIYRGVCVVAWPVCPLEYRTSVLALIQELPCLENGGYTILRNLLAAYQITLSDCIAAAVLPHIFIIVGPGYRRLEVKREEN